MDQTIENLDKNRIEYLVRPFEKDESLSQR